MGKVVLGMTISLDGFVNDRNGDVGRLYPDLEALHQTEVLQEAVRNTGAVVMGRHAFAMGNPDSYAGNYEFQVPIFVLARNAPEKRPRESGTLTITFVTDGVASAIEKARAAAGDKDVTVIGGADTAQQCLRAGLVDEIEIGIAPVLFGSGLRLFDHLELAQIELERSSTIEAAGVTYLRYRVLGRS